MIALKLNGGKLLDEVSTTGVADEAGIYGNVRHALQAINSGAGTFSVTVEASLNGTDFTPVATLNTANAITQLEGVYAYFRANVTALSGGAKVTLIYKGV